MRTKKIVVSLITFVLLLTTLTACSKSNTPEGWVKGKDLNEYVTNAQEVYDIIADEFNTENNISVKQSKNYISEITTLENFGNGNYWLTVNDTDFCIDCNDHIASYVSYDTGSGWSNKIIYTPTYEKMREELNDRLGNNEVNNILQQP